MSPDATRSQAPPPATAAAALLRGSVDYAGLFPPAGLVMRDAVARYQSYRPRHDAWLLGRFVVPASRLSEFEAAARASLETGTAPAWPLAILLSKAPEAELEALEAFCSRWARRVIVASLELPGLTPREIETQVRRLPRGAEVFVEVPWGDAPESQLDAIAAAGARAKARTGGLAQASFPSPRALAHFLVECKQRRLAFKATAGLHHALRAAYPLAYEADSGKAVMHGFLNLALAAALVHANKADEAIAEAVLRETAPRAFVFANKEAAWRELALAAPALQGCREAFFRSFGSCSFDEPAEELRGLGIV